jgi:hypothetical protein
MGDDRMTFRNGETDHFPVDRTDREIWYAIIVSDDNFSRYGFTSSKSGKKDFVEMIKELNGEKQKTLLLGIWKGQWKTDLFILDEKIIVDKINSL